ncbi:NUDIX hydrolase [Candidatus Woesearchaeota archaeon]|mgnify:CR=1 FL=1|nr:NUDIX hydrolase [Candidatus Woesearchaeota archaeon]|tara:strand:+ start:151 stop:828 length:678 start_codon:yes stop_codon:yes gene_type:complete
METRGFMQVAVDAVVFTVLQDELRILLIKRKYPPFKGMYALPGGFVNKGEELEEAVKRELDEETGVKDVFLKQIGTYGGVRRDPRGRILSVAFLALIQPNQRLKAATDAMDAEWFAVDGLPELGFDHSDIISDALEQLRYEVQTTNIAFQILPKSFTLTQLQQLYEDVLGRGLDKRNFRKKVKELGILKETSEMLREGAHRPARLYRFVESKYSGIRDEIHVFLG